MGKTRDRRRTRQTDNSDKQTDGEKDDPIPTDDTTTHHLDSDSSDTEQPSTSSHSCKPKIQIFKGLNDKISIENWLKRYEMLAIHFKWSESDKIVFMGNYLEDDALNWYIENSSDNYSDLKHKLINRFGVEIIEPIVEFVNIRYDVKSGIKDYFEKKRRYGNLAKLTVEQMIPIMVNSLHPKMVESFVAVKPKTLTEFYSIAKSAENNLKRFFNRPAPNDKPKIPYEPKNGSNKRKPPNACRICENLGFKNRFHWSNDCRNKGKTNAQNTNSDKKVNLVEDKPDLHSEENDIRNIDLNL